MFGWTSSTNSVRFDFSQVRSITKMERVLQGSAAPKSSSRSCLSMQFNTVCFVSQQPSNRLSPLRKGSFSSDLWLDQEPGRDRGRSRSLTPRVTDIEGQHTTVHREPQTGQEFFPSILSIVA